LTVLSKYRQSNSAYDVNILVLKKALDIQAASELALSQSFRQPALATQGTAGTGVNTYA
jgi:hypothetical protein